MLNLTMDVSIDTYMTEQSEEAYQLNFPISSWLKHVLIWNYVIIKPSSSNEVPTQDRHEG